MNFIALKPDQIQARWGDLSQGMEKLFKQTLGLWGPDDILNNCCSGKWLLFSMFEDDKPVVSLVVEIREGEQRVFDVGFCWGTRLDEWIDEVYNSFEVIARQCDCDVIAFNGRPGWKYLARHFGFKVNSMTYIKGLT